MEEKYIVSTKFETDNLVDYLKCLFDSIKDPKKVKR